MSEHTEDPTLFGGFPRYESLGRGTVWGVLWRLNRVFIIIKGQIEAMRDSPTRSCPTWGWRLLRSLTPVPFAGLMFPVLFSCPSPPPPYQCKRESTWELQNVSSA